MLETLTHDLRLAARTWSRTPALAAVIVATVAVGIAACTIVFALVNGLVLRDLPFEAPDRIVHVTTVSTANGRVRPGGVSYLEFRDWQANARAFDGLSAYAERPMNVADDSAAAARFRGSYVSANSFSLIGQRPAFGRDFQPDDDRAGAAPVVILGHGVWRARYRADPGIVGRTIRVNGVASTVVGVMPDGFGFPRTAALWQPLTLLSPEELSRRDVRRLGVVGRMKPAVTIEQGRADIAVAAASLAERFPESQADIAPRMLPFRDATYAIEGRRLLWILMSAVACILLIACANVTNLLLARSVVRSREMSLRLSVGASRRRIVRQLLVENLLLAIVAGGAALLLSLAGLRLYTRAFVPDGAYWFDFTMDARVFAFLAVVSVSTAVLFGVLPALKTSTTNVSDLLTQAGRGATSGRRHRRWMGGLVVVQLALAIVLLTSAGLSIRDAIELIRIDVGIDASRLTLARFNLPPSNYPTAERRGAFYARLDESLRSLPGAQATFASDWPRGGAERREVSFEGRADEISRPLVSYVTIGPRYFESIGASPVRGRDFSDTAAADAALVNERFAAIHFRGRDPIGQRIRIEASEDGPGSAWLTIVGVAPNVRQWRAGRDRQFDPIVYVPYASRRLPWAMLLVRSDSSPGVAAPLLRNRVRRLDPDLPLFDVLALEEVLARDRAEVRELSTLFAIFAAVALLLAAVGLAAVTAYAISQRTREIGIRVALGAQAVHVWWLVTRRASWQMGVGLLIGVAGALGAGQILHGLLEQVNGTDPLTFIGVPVVLVMVGLLACSIPARRATKLDPIAALRAE
jgi:predicted permease